MKIYTIFFLLVLAAFPAMAQSFTPDADKSEVTFTIKNFGVSTGGEFKGLKGTIVFDATRPAESSFDVSIEATTINTDVNARDNHLRKSEYFDVANHPRITFKTDRVTASGKPGSYTAYGKLTIKGTTKDISFPFTAVATSEGLTFNGNFEINRRDYNVGGNSLVLGDNVKVSLTLYARKK